MFSILLSGACFVWLGFQYKWYHGCGIGLFILILTTVFVVFFYVVALVKLCNIQIFRKNATVFTVSLAVIYIVYMCWTALASNPDQKCNPFILSNANTAL